MYSSEVEYGGTYHNPLELLNVHGSFKRRSGKPWIKVCGEKYDYVKGEKPYHLFLPRLNAVLFVTEANIKQRRFPKDRVHLVFLQNGKHYAVEVDENFGDGIGGRAEGYDKLPMTYVTEVDWPKLQIMEIGSTAVIHKYDFDFFEKQYTEVGQPR
jgi:hypothetical protein